MIVQIREGRHRDDGGRDHALNSAPDVRGRVDHAVGVVAVVDKADRSIDPDLARDAHDIVDDIHITIGEAVQRLALATLYRKNLRLSAMAQARHRIFFTGLCS